MLLKNTMKKAGFTLLELMIVLIIMGFVIALAGPSVTSGLRGLSLKTTAKKVAAALRYARSQAVNTGSIYHVVFDKRQQQVTVISVQNPTETIENNGNEEQNVIDEKNEPPPIKEPQIREKKTVHFPKGITLKQIIIGKRQVSDEDEEIARMEFFPNGASQGGELVLEDNREREYSITVNFLTGVVNVAKIND